MGVAWAGQMFCWDPSSLSPRAKTTAKDARRARMFGRAEHPGDDCGESLDQWKDLASRSIVPSLRFGMFDSFEALLRKAPWI